ncbi:3-oxoacyl-[acyl-carrier-protein] reductase isoform X1 [Zootoca vivipara]|uniref:3-oxoacyl-[acyl-carrier-protein] reductase isoform X1 n=1 Tax=Zootoca vivipara TaxID=8524 RepID=UPI00293BDC0E|nr:3-oxoacyl-[acyl-carrier-protein] reductase isoform X1 [Zootoca vivipara]
MCTLSVSDFFSNHIISTVHYFLESTCYVANSSVSVFMILAVSECLRKFVSYCGLCVNTADHLAFRCDVSKEEDIQNVFKEMETSLGQINYLVNAAGINRDGLLLRTKADDMLAQLQTNLLGTMLTCKAAVKGMIQQQGGAIVNIGSIVGLKGNSGQSVYSASKAGLVGFSRSLAKEIARKNIRVNMVAPGFIHTDMTTHLKEEQLKKTIPLGRFGEPHEVAEAVAFLLESPYVTGQVLVIDGGLQLLF